jgi:hypothetical protein
MHVTVMLEILGLMNRRSFSMNWKDPRKELPGMDKSYRCIAMIETKGCWEGYCDVYFSAISGWRRCETEEMVCVKKWAYIEELENDN